VLRCQALGTIALAFLLILASLKSKSKVLTLLKSSGPQKTLLCKLRTVAELCIGKDG
jgi:hypothetical protein